MLTTKRVFLAIILMVLLTACATGSAPPDDELTPVTLMLDWTPNVNHTGLFVALDQGYYDDAGLALEIVQPGEVYPEQAVTSGSVDFGISFQEYVTLLRATEDVPLVSIAAIIQHNTSGFASRPGLEVASPADWESLTYGTFGTPFEEPTLQALMECAGGDFSTVDVVDTGFADPLALLDEGQIDLAWIFFGTQGVAAEQQSLDLDIVMMSDYFDCIPDYYTPVLVASQTTLDERPDVVRAFLSATARGYQFAIDDPAAAADILLEQTPESGRELLAASQKWLSPRYQADAPQWGYQAREVWANYAQWMVDNGIIDAMIDVDAAFNTDYLP